MGRKVWTRAETVIAADMNTYLMDQSVMTFATAAARTTAIASPTQGMVTWRNDAAGPIKLEYYNGSSWVAISFTSPAQTVQGQSSVQTLTTVSHTPATSNVWSSWTSVGTSPASTSYMTEVAGTAYSGWAGAELAVVEFSLNGGATTWKRCLLLSSGNSCAIPATVTPRSAAASSTIHMRWKATTHNGGGTFSLACKVTWTQTAPAVTLSAAESLWESTGASATYGTWTTLGTVGAAHRLIGYGPCDVGSGDSGLATGATPTLIHRTGNATFMPGHNRAVPSGDLKVSGSRAIVYVLTEPV